MPEPGDRVLEQKGGHARLAPRCPAKGGFETTMVARQSADAPPQASPGLGDTKASHRPSNDEVVWQTTPPTDTVVLGEKDRFADRSTTGVFDVSVRAKAGAEAGTAMAPHAACMADKTTSRFPTARERFPGNERAAAVWRIASVVFSTRRPLTDLENPLHKSGQEETGGC